MWSETSTVLKLDGEAHYVRGGKPGYFPKLSRKVSTAELGPWITVRVRAIM